MKTKFALLLVFCAISLNIFAQEKKIKDRRTNPELYYLEESEVANSLELLPPPLKPEVFCSCMTKPVTTGGNCKGILLGVNKLSVMPV